MYEKALKWLGDILHFSPNVDLLRPSKRDHNKNNINNRNPLMNLPPCSAAAQRGATLLTSPFSSNTDNGTTNNTGRNNTNTWSTTHLGQAHSSDNNRPLLYVPPSLPQTGPRSSHHQIPGLQLQGLDLVGHFPLCSSSSNLHNIQSHFRTNLTTQLHGGKFSIHGKWPGGRGRAAWGPPGLELGGATGGGGGETPSSSSSSSTTTGGVGGAGNFWEQDHLKNNSTYPDYYGGFYGGFYNYNYDDYDQSDWLSNHLEELYDIMRSSQIDTNIALTAFLAVVFLFGVTGNILVLAVFSRGAMQQQASTVFIKALAVTDLVICLVVLPGVLLKEWYIPYRWDVVCQGWELIRCSTIPLSTLILASVAVDRYVKICRVDRSLHISTATAKKILLVTATISVCLGIPPMLRMGVYQAGAEEGGGGGPDDGPQDGTDAGTASIPTPAPTKIYLGLCMGNDLLVSKRTVDRYWQVMAAKFLLVLLVVTVMYGLVFRTVYRQSRRWGRCGGGGGGGGGSGAKGWFKKGFGRNGNGGKGCLNKGYVGNDESDDDIDDDCKDVENNTERGKLCSEGATGVCCGKGTPSNSPLENEARGCRQNETENIKPFNERSNVKAGKCPRHTNHVTTTIEKIQTEKKKSSISLSFLCSSKRNCDDVVKDNKPPKIPSYQQQQDELHDDGITSLDDGHVSYLNAPSASSSQQQAEETKKRKKKPLSAILSCTSQLTVSRSAYISKKSYYHSEVDVEEEADEEIGEERMKNKLGKGKMFVPHWLRRWKRLVTVALFTTAAQRDEEQRSAVKLALRQKAKIRMMNQEASCDIEAAHPDSNAERFYSTTDNTTTTTKLSSSNLGNNYNNIIMANASETKLKKWSQSLDFEISNPDHHKKARAQARLVRHNAASIDNDTGGWTLSNLPSAPLENTSTMVPEQYVTIDLDDATTGKNHTPTVLSINGKVPTLPTPGGSLQESTLTDAMISDDDTLKSNKDHEVLNIPQTNDGSIQKPDQTPFEAWIHRYHHNYQQNDKEDPFSINTCSKTEHKKVLNTSSYPLNKPTSGRSGGKAGVGGNNKVHPLNSPYFSHSVPNIRVTQAIMLSELKENNSENDQEMSAASNKRRVFSESRCGNEINGSQTEDIYCLETDTDSTQTNEMCLVRCGQGRQVDECGILKDVDDIEGDVNGSMSLNKHLSPLSTQETMQMNRMKSGSNTKGPPRYRNRNGEQTNQNVHPLHHPQCFQKQSTQNRNGRSRSNGRGNDNEGHESEGASRSEKVRNSELGTTRGGPHHRYNRAQVKTAQVLFLVTVVYVLSFAPVLLMSVEAVPPHPIPFYGYFIHSAANPILYSFINEAFRSQLYNLLCPRCSKKK